jgi:hypothetical protein
MIGGPDRRRAMPIRKLDKSEWRTFFDRITKGLLGKRAEIEVAALNLGDQIEVEWLPLLGITYDSKDDIVEIALDGLDHLVHGPKEIYVDIAGAGLTRLEIIDRDGVARIVQLRDPLMLPAPGAVSG